MKNKIKSIINKLPYVRGLNDQISRFNRNSCYPPGHYYSPIISVDDVQKRADDIWKGASVNKIEGIDLNVEEQLTLVKSFESYYSEIPFTEYKEQNLRYYFNNDQYRHTDAIILYSVIRHFKPKRIIEVGSGFSTAVILDTKQLFLNNLELTCIEPYPERLFSLMSEEDRKKCKVFIEKLQNIDLVQFEKLEKDDILFIDSSHISKTGSDVNFVLFDILPRLQSGVLIHFHDIFYPFEYPKSWVLGGRNWNEDYLLRAFLLYNTSFKVKLFVDFLHMHYKNAFSEMPLCYKDAGGSLWIQKI